VKIPQIAHPLCITDAHPHGKNTKFWLIQKLTQQDRGCKRETAGNRGGTNNEMTHKTSKLTKNHYKRLKGNEIRNENVLKNKLKQHL